MTFANGDEPGADTSLPHRRIDYLLLRRTVWGRHTGTAPILVDRTTNQHGNAVNGLHIIDTIFQKHRSDTLPSRKAICRVIKRETTPFLAQHSRTTERDVTPLPHQRVY